jgi:hypothetical protein
MMEHIIIPVLRRLRIMSSRPAWDTYRKFEASTGYKVRP